MTHYFSSKDQNDFLDVIGYPKSLLLSNPLSKPVTKAKILVNQVASHSILLGLANSSSKTMPKE